MTLNGVVGTTSIAGGGTGTGGTVALAFGDTDGFVIASSGDPNEVFDNPPTVTLTSDTGSASGPGTAPTIAAGTGGSSTSQTLGAPDVAGNDYTLSLTCGSVTSTFTLTVYSGTGSGTISNPDLVALFGSSTTPYPAAGTSLGTLSGSCSANGTATFQ